MITVAALTSNPNETIAIRQPEAYEQAGWYPTSYSTERLANPDGYRIALTGLTWRAGE